VSIQIGGLGDRTKEEEKEEEKKKKQSGAGVGTGGLRRPAKYFRPGGA
jgi:hypothetical protein